ncbi:MAG: metalloregulator ArsR/SmtB family transcription factor [Acetobacteraceae bacterium]|nr:metalloregulator ArsR/SmtB family transcription factor [Acetobacteraceae bacterium]
MAERLRTFAQPHRLMILSVLLEGERAVGDIAQATGIGQPALSQQLAELRRADLVATRREARQIYYRIVTEELDERVRAVFAAFGAARSVARVVAARASAPVDPTGAAAFVRIG